MALSRDGKLWEAALVLENEPGECSCPGDHPDPRRPCARHVHLEAPAHQARGDRSEAAADAADARRQLACDDNQIAPGRAGPRSDGEDSHERTRHETPTAAHLSWLVAVFTAVLASFTITPVTARQPSGAPVTVDKDDLGGVVTSAKGPEAGVWVIAETTELPTKFAKIVVTDDRGRYLIPDMPAVKYNVWYGYGLVDSKVQASPGTTLNLNAVAPNAKAAAEYYPAGYWFSLMKAPDAKEFPGTGPSGNGIAPGMRSQAEWLRQMKNGTCPRVPPAREQGDARDSAALGTFSSTAQAWERRLASGQAG